MRRHGARVRRAADGAQSQSIEYRILRAPRRHATVEAAALPIPTNRSIPLGSTASSQRPGATGATARPAATQRGLHLGLRTDAAHPRGVIGVIYLLFWLLRRGSGKRIQENDLIRVLGSRSLAGNRALHLVEVGTSIYLVGSSDGGVELISEITDKESLDSRCGLKAAEEDPAARRNFPQILSEIFRPGKESCFRGGRHRAVSRASVRG